MPSTEETKPSIDQNDGVNAIAKRKMKKMVRLALEDVDWAALAAGGPEAKAFLSDSCRCAELLYYFCRGEWSRLCMMPLCRLQPWVVANPNHSIGTPLLVAGRTWSVF